MTNCLFRKFWYLTVAAVLLFASASLAQTTSFTLTGVGNNPTVLGDVYVDPYTATVGGVTNTPAICVDWSDNTYLQESWTANVTAVPSVTNSSPVLFGPSNNNPKGATGSNLTSLYNELAYLATQLMSDSTIPADQIEISFAMWELTYPYAPNPDPNWTPQNYLNTYGSGYASGVESFLNQAAENSNYNGSKWEILTPDLSDSITCANGSACATTPPQEFFVQVTGTGNGDPVTAPESSATLVFGADMLGLLGLAFVFRRRLLRTIQ